VHCHQHSGLQRRSRQRVCRSLQARPPLRECSECLGPNNIGKTRTLGVRPRAPAQPICIDTDLLRERADKRRNASQILAALPRKDVFARDFPTTRREKFRQCAHGQARCLRRFLG